MKQAPTLRFLLALTVPSLCNGQLLPQITSVSSDSNPFGKVILREGSNGSEVSALQKALNSMLKPSPGLTVNGNFDSRTKAAVIEFQQQEGISNTGEVGLKTMAALGADVDPYFSESSGINSNTGPQAITRNVVQASNGDLWLATWNGVMRYDGKRFVNVTNKEGLRRFRTFSLLEDHEKNIWIGTIGAGLYRYDGKAYVNLTTKDGLVGNAVISMMQDSDYNLWFGGRGLSKYNGTTFTTFTEKDGFTNSDVNSISQARDGTIWLGTRGALFHYDGKTFVNFTKKHGLNIIGYIPTVIDRKGHLWFGGKNGIYHYDGEKVQHLFHSSSYSLMEDSKGNIWYSGGTLKGQDPKPGISILNRFDPASGLNDKLTPDKQYEVKGGRGIFGLTEDKDGQIWFGTGRGVCRIDGDTVRYY